MGLSKIVFAEIFFFFGGKRRQKVLFNFGVFKCRKQSCFLNIIRRNIDLWRTHTHTQFAWLYVYLQEVYKNYLKIVKRKRLEPEKIYSGSCALQLDNSFNLKAGDMSLFHKLNNLCFKSYKQLVVLLIVNILAINSNKI